MNKKDDLEGEFEMKDGDLFRQDGLHLQAKIRHKMKKGTAKRFIGKLEGEVFTYISSLYPTKDRNVFDLEWNGIRYVLELLSETKVKIEKATKQEKEPEVALFFRGND